MANEQLNFDAMSLEEIKAAALAEEAKQAEPTVPEQAEAVAAPADMELPKEEAEPKVTPEPEPEQFVVRSEIDLGDGSGVQVFTGRGDTELEALRDQNSKLVEAQRNATRKIHDLNSRVKLEDTRTAQQQQDDEFVIAQRLQKEPSKAIRDVVKEVIAEREAAAKRSLEVQQEFVDAHPEYVPDADNGARITSEVQRLGYSEFTEESLEKAYQSLKKSGLLKIKAEEAGGTTEAEPLETERIAQPKVEATQPRSPKKASTVSTRGSHAPVIKTEPSEDELYSMPLDKLRQEANRRLAAGE